MRQNSVLFSCANERAKQNTKQVKFDSKVQTYDDVVKSGPQSDKNVLNSNDKKKSGEEIIFTH